MPEVLEIHEFFVEGGDERKSHVLLRFSEPSTPLEKNKGYFFAITEINLGEISQIKEIQKMIDDIESAYFSSDNDDSNAFENAISNANHRGHHILSSERTGVHCVVGVLQKNTVSFAFHGSPEAMLLYRKDDCLLHTDAINDDEPDNGRLFSSIMSGSVKNNEYFYVATPKVKNFFSSDRIKKLLDSRAVKESAEHIEKVLSSVRNGDSYGGIFFHIMPAADAPKTGPMPKFINNNDDEKSKIKKTSGQKQEETNYRPRRLNEAGYANSIFGIALAGIGRVLASSAMVIIKALKLLMIAFGKFSIFLIIIITNKGGQREIVIGDMKRALSKKKEQISRLSFISKALFGFAILSALVFVGSIFIFRYKEASNARAAEFSSMAQNIRDKKDAADASAIYGDDAKAMSLIKEAGALLEKLPKRNQQEKNTASVLSENIGAILKKLQKWTEIQSELIIDLAKPQPNARPDRIVALDDAIIAYGQNDSLLYIVNPNAKNMQLKPHEAIKSLFAANTPKEQDSVIFANGNQSVAVYKKQTNEISTADISFPDAAAKITDLFVYNQRLFTLSPSTNQIYKHAKTQTGFDKGAPWIKDASVKISDAVGLAIDGDIYVLTNNNVRHFSSGNEIPFSNNELSPALDHPSMIWTYNGVNNLYIVEPANKRLIVLDKSGKLIRQYTDKKWNRPTSIIIDEENHNAFIFDSGSIFKFNLE